MWCSGQLSGQCKETESGLVAKYRGFQHGPQLQALVPPTLLRGISSRVSPKPSLHSSVPLDPMEMTCPTLGVSLEHLGQANGCGTFIPCSVIQQKMLWEFFSPLFFGLRRHTEGLDVNRN